MLYFHRIGNAGLALGAALLLSASVASASVSEPRIIAFGDSTTAARYGAGVTTANGGRPSTGTTTAGINMTPYTLITLNHDVDGPTLWLYNYCDILRDELPGLIGKPVDSINSGLSGNMSHQAVDRVDTDVLGRDADVVVIQYGINDSVFKNGMHNVALDAAEEATYDPFVYTRGNFIDNMTSVVQQAKAEGLRVILMTPNHVPATSVDCTALPQYAQAIRDISVSEDVELVDVYALYDILANDTVVTDPALLEVLPSNYLSLNPSNLLLADLIHPNGTGQRMVAEALMQVLVVPEPASMMLLGAFGGLITLGRRR